ncbi:O-antigen ligase family protein [Fulvivirga lutimaris]|uniref:O-antigen ligase family protein n=1 Tax=Fulvivirga lutimaris TaxID=1819566 RepID=UPI0012BB50C0|nr:O-antigen ligase family protein [Fulvivirga lutimaris]MTI39022.1 O-antigen ligase domain-containing protein [Fulvivirga lutimaris]
MLQSISKKHILIAAVATILSILCSLLIALAGVKLGIVALILLLGLPVAYLCIVNIEFGVYLSVTLGFFLYFIIRTFRLFNVPLGTGLDALAILMLLGLMLKLRKESYRSFAGNVVSLCLIVWLGVNFLEFFNPLAPSKMGWTYAVRNNMYIIIMYFIIYHILSPKFIRNFIVIWMLYMFLAGLYLLKQKYIGLNAIENYYVYEDPIRKTLYRTWGKIRYFSFFNDPMSYGIILSNSIVLSFGLLFTDIKKYYKYILVGLTLFMCFCLFQTNTRTAFFLLPLGMMVFGLISFEKKVLGVVGAICMMGLLLIMMPGIGGRVHVFKTAFKGSEDPSMKVRLENQAMLRPYLYDQPLGYGLASTGGWGRQFNRNSFLGEFPPDSEYVRIVIETGWVGLLIWLTIMVLIFRKGVVDYFKERDKDKKILYAIFLAIFYMIIVAQYPQEALRIHPSGILTAFIIAILSRLKQVEFKRIE